MKITFTATAILITIALWFSAIAADSGKIALIATMSTLLTVVLMVEDEDE